jgi:UDP-2-acetamido-3-amino-2,3-dideoxy-glucuronate N-acetyltransferase
MNNEIHSTAVVDKPCEIGPGTRVWHFSHVCVGARIGADCSLGQNTLVAGSAVLGDRVKVQNNVSIYDGVTLEDDVFLGPSCVLTNITNPRSQVSRRHLYEQTLIRRGATIGANATILCGATIGRYAFVAAGAVVRGEVLDYALMLGVPARHGGWMSRHGHRLEFNENGRATCSESKLTYTLKDGSVTCDDVPEDEPLPDYLTKSTAAYGQFK